MFPFTFPKNFFGDLGPPCFFNPFVSHPGIFTPFPSTLGSLVFSQKGSIHPGVSWVWVNWTFSTVSHIWAQFPLSPHSLSCQVAKSGTSLLMSSSALPPKALATLEKSKVSWWLPGFPKKFQQRSSLSDAGLNCSGQHLFNRRSPSNQPNRATGGQVPFEILSCLRG